MPSLEVTLPTLAGNQSLTIGRWRKQAGDRIAAGEPLLEAHSEQYDWDIPAPHSGVLEAIRAVEGTTVAPGEAVATIGNQGEDASVVPRISPLAANVARALGVDLGGLRGSGPGGRIVRADVLAAAHTTAGATASFPKARHALASRIAAQWRAVPHASLTAVLVLEAVDADLWSRRAAWRDREGFELDRLPYLLAAVLAALRTAPELNVLLTPDGIAYRAACHLAVSVPEEADYAPRGGVIRNAEQYALVGLARRLHALPGRDGAEGATFALRIARGVFATAVLAPGQSGCLTVGAATARPGASPSGELRTQMVAHACLTWDARLLDEFAAARFFAQMQRALDSASA